MSQDEDKEKKSNVTLKTIKRNRALLESRVAEALEKFIRDTGLAVQSLTISTDITGDKVEVKAKVDLDGAL